MTLTTLAAAYLALAVAACAAQRAMLYPAPPVAREPTLAGGALLRIPGPEGSTVYAFHVPAPQGAPTVAHFHGNGEQLADTVWLASSYREAGLGFFAVEYPGYGLASAQAPSEAAIFAAAEAALVHLTGPLAVPSSQVVLQGQSLGSGVAVELAARGHGARVALISPYTSITELGQRMLPFLPVSSMVRDRFDSAAKAPAVKLPVLIVHGTADEVVPFEMGERLGALFPSATLRRVEGAHHNDVLDAPGVLAALQQFALGLTP